MNRSLIWLAIFFGTTQVSFAQKPDTAGHAKENSVHAYLIISAGDKISAFFNDKPISAETVPEFNDYVQANMKSLKDAWVVVTGKPKSGTYDEVIKILSRYRIKHVSKNITGG